MRRSRDVEGLVMADPIAEIRGRAIQDANEYVARFNADERKQRAAKAAAEHERLVKVHAPSWARWRAERELESLVAEVAASSQKPTADQLAAAGRLLDSLGGAK
jgi:hypothetical protein